LSVRTNRQSRADPKATFQEEIVELIRALGLHRPDQTPCGQPISVAEAQAVLELSRQPGISQNGLATRLRLEKSTVSRVASMLERRAWIERSRDTNDARILRLRLTPSGLKAAQALAASREAKFSKVFEAIPPGKRDSVLQSLALLSQVLNQE
jgi:DNA-binding MarR family transcriptional regulator